MSLAIVLFGFVSLSYAAHLPSGIEVCKTSDPNFRKCLMSSAEKAFVVLANGNEELGIRPLDPLHMTEVVVEPIPGPINIYQKYTDIVLKGISTGKVKDFGVDLDNCKLWINHTIKPLITTTNYEVKGQLLLLPVDAKGQLKSVCDTFEVYIAATCEKFTKHGKEYLHILNTEVVFKVKNINFDFGVFINGNPQLDDDLHKVVDDNPEDFFEIIRPSCEALWNTAVFEMLNSVFTKIPLNELF